MRLGILIAGITVILFASIAMYQVRRERGSDEDDLTRRAALLSHRILRSASQSLALSDAEIATVLGERLDGYRRLLGLAVFRMDGSLAASGRGLEETEGILLPVVERVLQGEPEVSTLVRDGHAELHVYAHALTKEDGSTAGALAVVHDAGFLGGRARERLLLLGLWAALSSLVILSAVVGLAWLSYERPLERLADWMKRLRVEATPPRLPHDLPSLVLARESEHLAASIHTARSTIRSLSRAPSLAEDVASRERLLRSTLEHLAGDQLVVVSNREPYMHEVRGGETRVIVPASGVVTAFDPVLRACGGLWIAHGSGEADLETAGSSACVAVPPEDPRYTLRRVWLSKKEEQGYYYGFSNEGLWPLCHQVHERPVFRASDWQDYATVNRRFAAATLEEIGPGSAIVLVQDFHLALVPKLLKSARPDLRVGMFWHVPWPTTEALRICPWRAEILEGMLGADVLGFHSQQHCNNFLDAADRMIEARVDRDHLAVEHNGRRTLIRPFPIGVESWSYRNVPTGQALGDQQARLREQHELGDLPIVVGVDRMDYTKGLLERLHAIERFFERYPEHRERLTFVVLGVPSRTHLRRYRTLVVEVEALADQINWKLRSERWKPIHLLVGHHDSSTVHAFLSMATACIVSSLHDGMNLVAKEFVAAQTNADGVLVLSEFTGAASELTDAVLVNPYDIEAFASAIRAAVVMPAMERRQRMERMRRIVSDNDVHHWTGQFIAALAGTKRLASLPA